jgi:Flp pilus assembly protein TadD
LAALVLSGFYLYTFPIATIPYFGIELAHIGGGLLFAIVVLLSLFKLGGTPTTMKLGWLSIAAGTALGVALTFTGAMRPMLPLLYGHIFLCITGVLFLLTGFFGAQGWLSRSSVLRFASLLVLTLLVGTSAWATREVRWQNSHRITNPTMPPESQDYEGQGVNGDFFPSSVRTNTGKRLESEFFMRSDACQRCHADIFKQWNSSAHHFSSFNNQWYRKSIEYMQDVIGVKPSRWCAGCHDPALLFSGKFDTPVREIINTPEAQAGLGCVMCHSVSKVHSSMGQADYTLEYPTLAKLAANENRFARALHDFLVYVNPEPHRRTFMKPFVREDNGEFCAGCHKVHLDTHVNNYRWVRGFNDYDNWQASGVSGMGARSFYYPPKSARCIDCHMPTVDSNDAGNINGKIHSHRFPGANTALPTANRDQEQLDAVTKFLKNGILTVDIFGVSPAREASSSGGSASGDLATTFAVGEEGEARVDAVTAEVAPLMAPLDRAETAVAPGETYRVDVVVRTRKIGHFFPGGTVDAFDVWLELEARDDAGRVIFSSGAVADNGKGPVDKSAHFYRSLQIDAHGNPIDKRNAWSTRSLVYVRLIPPGAADTVHYRLKVPPDAKGKIHLTTRLHYRKFAWFNTQFAFAGERVAGSAAATPHYDDGKFTFTADTSGVSGEIKSIPDLPIITIAENKATLDVVRGADLKPTPIEKSVADDWTRWNDYGIGLLLQGDLKGAEAAFTNVTKIAPSNPDGWVNIGRARLLEGNLEGARDVLDRAIGLAPNLARAHYFFSRVLRAEGAYDEALSHLKTVIDQYPKDRVVRNDAGRILFLQKKYAEAIKEFQAVLTIDPEDLQAHYNLMLCYNGLGDEKLALEHQKRYLRFKADEAAQAITGPYRNAHPEDNNERQAIHEHASAAAGKGGAK